MRTYPYAIVGVAVLYMFLRGVLEVSIFLEGLFFGTIIVLLGNALIRPQVAVRFPKVVRRVPAFLWYSLSFLRSAVTSTIDVSYRVLSPRMPIHPGVLAVSMAGLNDVEIAMLANSITLTPGTIAVDVDRERQIMYVHSIDARDVKEVVERIKALEHNVVAVFR